MKTDIKIIIKPIILLIFTFFVLFPTIAFASWWNPFSWNVWNNVFHKANNKTQVLENRVKELEKKLGDAIATSSKELNVEATSTAVKKTVTEEIKKIAPVVVVPKSITSPVDSNNNLSNPTPLSVESWTKLENRYFAEASQKGLVTLIITNNIGEKRYYRKEGVLWFRKNNEVEMQQSYDVPPTTQQLANLRRFCLSDSNINKFCQDPIFMPSYYSNEKARLAVDDLIRQYNAILSDREKQRVVAEKSIMDCLMAPSPEEEHLLDPDTKMYLLQLRCGTVTAADRTNYELSRIKSSVDELKYRLDSKISFLSLFLDQIKTPTLDTTKWQVRWDGSGGTVTNSAGSIYQFHCEDDTCRSY